MTNKIIDFFINTLKKIFKLQISGSVIAALVTILCVVITGHYTIKSVHAEKELARKNELFFKRYEICSEIIRLSNIKEYISFNEYNTNDIGKIAVQGFIDYIGWINLIDMKIYQFSIIATNKQKFILFKILDKIMRVADNITLVFCEIQKKQHVSNMIPSLKTKLLVEINNINEIFKEVGELALSIGDDYIEGRGAKLSEKEETELQCMKNRIEKTRENMMRLISIIM